MTDQDKIESLKRALLYVAEELDRAVILFRERKDPSYHKPGGQQVSPSLETIQLDVPSAARNAEKLMEGILYVLTEIEKDVPFTL